MQPERAAAFDHSKATVMNTVTRRASVIECAGVHECLLSKGNMVLKSTQIKGAVI